MTERVEAGARSRNTTSMQTSVLAGMQPRVTAWTSSRRAFYWVFAAVLLGVGCRHQVRSPDEHSPSRLDLTAHPEPTWSALVKDNWVIYVPALSAKHESTTIVTAITTQDLSLILMRSDRPDCAIKKTAPCSVHGMPCRSCATLIEDPANSQTRHRVSISVEIDDGSYVIASCSSVPTMAPVCRRIVGTLRFLKGGGNE